MRSFETLRKGPWSRLTVNIPPGALLMASLVPVPIDIPSLPINISGACRLRLNQGTDKKCFKRIVTYYISHSHPLVSFSRPLHGRLLF